MRPRNIQLAFVQCCESLINDHPHVTLIFVESLHLISWMLQPTAQAVFSSCSVTTDICLLICRRGCGAKSSPHACLMRWCGILREKSTLTSSEAFALEKYVPYDIFLCSVAIIRLCFYALLIYQLINMLKLSPCTEVGNMCDFRFDLFLNSGCRDVWFVMYLNFCCIQNGVGFLVPPTQYDHFYHFHPSWKTLLFSL